MNNFIGRRGTEDAEMRRLKAADVMGMMIFQVFNSIEFLCVLCASAANK
jgi:hypothetical protein